MEPGKSQTSALVAKAASAETDTREATSPDADNALTRAADEGKQGDLRSQGPPPGQKLMGTEWWNPHPLYEPGNLEAVTHGAYSPRLYEPRARELVDEIRSSLPWLTPAHGPALWAWAKDEARAEKIEQWLADRATLDNAGGMLDDDGEVRAATKLLMRLQTSAANHRKELGMTPLAAARLGRDTAAGQLDVARLMAALDDEDQEEDGDV